MKWRMKLKVPLNCNQIEETFNFSFKRDCNRDWRVIIYLVFNPKVLFILS